MQHRDVIDLGRAVDDLGVLSKMNNDIDGAIKYGEEALSIFRSIKDSENQTLAMSFLSSYYYIAGKPLKVLELDAELEKIYETNGDKSRLAVVDYTIGALKSNGADRAEAADGDL